MIDALKTLENPLNNALLIYLYENTHILQIDKKFNFNFDHGGKR